MPVDKICIIVPRIVVHHNDPHTGIPFMPHIAAHLAGVLNNPGIDLKVIDCFGLQPHQRQIEGEFMLLGVDEDFVISELDTETSIAFIYCRTVEDLLSTEKISQKIREVYPRIKIVFFENTQSVNSFSLKELVDKYLNSLGDLAILGEPENRGMAVVNALLRNNDDLKNIEGIAYKTTNGDIEYTAPPSPNHQLDELPLPLWEKFPLEGYWIANFAHAPSTSRRFLPILTSRGCPYRCTFCISPTTNPVWRGRSASNVVDEMEYFNKVLNITDYHISDLDPTINDKRIQEICREIIKRNLKITWKLAQGTKIETIKSIETLEIMAKAGCRFISFSPETGSKRLLEIMNKKVDFEYAIKLAREMNRLGIRTQACFIAGVPGENNDDRILSIKLVRRLVASGVDEIAVTIFTPLPGTALSDSLTGYSHYSQLTHSPNWREDYKIVSAYRYKMYLNFFIWKLLWPKKVIRELIGFFSKNFETKMEMSVYKTVKLRLLYYIPFIYKKLNAKKRMLELNQIQK